MAAVADIAKVCHEVNKAWCEANMDNSQLPWDDAPQWQIDSCVAGVRFHLENPEAGDAASHNSWLAHKQADGWKYGPMKSESLKEHPAMVPFEDLPFYQQFKDKLFRTIVHAMRS